MDIHDEDIDWMAPINPHLNVVLDIGIIRCCITYLPVSSVTVKFWGGVPIPTDTKYCDPWSLYNGVLKGSLLLNWCKGADFRINGKRSSGGSTSLWIAVAVTALVTKANESMEGIIIEYTSNNNNNKEKKMKENICSNKHTCKQDQILDELD